MTNIVNNSKVLEKYLEDSKRTLIDKGNELNLIHTELGLITELGELNDIVKKHVFYGKTLDTVNMVEEIGDIMWYLAIVVRFVQEQYTTLKYNEEDRHMFIFEQYFDFELINDKQGRDISFNPRENDYINLMQVQQFISDDKLNRLLKIYNHFVLNLVYCLNVNEKNLTEILTAINNLLNVTLFFARCLDVSFEQILDINIKKLKVRFPEKFSSELALNRNLEAERELLEVMGVEKTEVKLNNNFFKKMEQQDNSLDIDTISELDDLFQQRQTLNENEYIITLIKYMQMLCTKYVNKNTNYLILKNNTHTYLIYLDEINIINGITSSNKLTKVVDFRKITTILDIMQLENLIFNLKTIKFYDTKEEIAKNKFSKNFSQSMPENFIEDLAKELIKEIEEKK